MSSVSKRTQRDIIDYIRTHIEDGKLTKSLLDIAKDIGYSNATIHRALNALSEQGLIDIRQAPQVSLPNTIIYKGDDPKDQIDQLLTKGAELTESVRKLEKEISEFVEEVTWFARQSSDKHGSSKNKQIELQI